MGIKRKEKRIEGWSQKCLFQHKKGSPNSRLRGGQWLTKKNRKVIGKERENQKWSQKITNFNKLIKIIINNNIVEDKEQNPFSYYCVFLFNSFFKLKLLIIYFYFINWCVLGIEFQNLLSFLVSSWIGLWMSFLCTFRRSPLTTSLTVFEIYFSSLKKIFGICFASIRRISHLGISLGS